MELKSTIEKLRSSEGIFKAQQVELGARWRELSKYGQDTAISNLDLLIPMVVYDEQYNVIELSKALVCALDGEMAVLDQLMLAPVSPFERLAEELSNEQAAIEELAAWCHSDARITPI